MAPSGNTLSDYTPIGGSDNGQAGSGAGAGGVAQFFSKHGQKLWWSVVGIATIIALALLIHAYTRPGTLPPQPTGVMTKDVEALYKLSWPIPDVKARKLMESQNSPAPGGNILKSSPASNQNENIVSNSVMQEALTAAAVAQTNRLATEQDMLTKGYVVAKNSPTGKHMSFTKSNPKAQKIAEKGFSMDQASKYVATKMNLTKDQASRGSKNNDMSDPSKNIPAVPCIPELNITTCEVLKSINNTYHSSDGLCNNVKNAGWGASNQPYRRILVPDYADGVSSPRVASDGTALPHPRKISTVLHSDRKGDDPIASLLLPIFGQFVDHDITNTVLGPGASSRVLNCCNGDKVADNLHPECFPFGVKEGDELYSQEGEKCTNLWRSSRYPSCDFGPRNQFSQTTSYIDGSVIYGSVDDAVHKFRAVNIDNPHGYMTSFTTDDGRKLLPVSTDLLDGCNIPEETGQGKFCFTSGDDRVNEQMALTSMHLLWSRQHNRIADTLLALNPLGHDGKVYFETREIIIAQIQHVTYNEFLPILLGKELSDAAGLTLLTDGYYSEYDDTIDASISNVFASGAYRMGHSMMQGTVKMMDAKRNTMESVPLSELLFNPFRLWNPEGLDAIVRGHASSPAGQVDTSITSQLTHHLFENRNGSLLGLDLAALNVQRGRDHGLPSYTRWREACGLDPVLDFNNLTGLWNQGNLDLARNIYTTVEDVDLYTGMLSEKQIPGGMVGPTLGCLLTDQFLRLRKGDRYWYEGSSRARPFTEEQLKMIRKTTLARIICDNGDNIQEIQARVLEQPSLLNPIIQCNSASIPTLEYSEWFTNVNSGLLPHKN